MPRRQITMPLWYTLLIWAVCITAIVASGITYTHGQIHKSEVRQAAAKQENDRRWCALLVQLDDTLPAASTIKPLIHNLRGQFGCDHGRRTR